MKPTEFSLWPGRWMAIGAFLLCSAFLLPNHYPPWTTFHSEALAALAFVPISLWAATRVAHGIPSLTVLLWSMALIPLLQWACGLIVYKGDALVVTTYLMGTGAVCIAGAECRKLSAGVTYDQQLPISKDPPTLLSAALALATIMSFGAAVHQWLDLRLLGVLIEGARPGGRPYANLGQPNHLASLALMGLIGLIYLFEHRRIGFATTLMGATCSLLTAVLTQSRTVALAGAAILIFAWAKRRSVASRVRWLHVAGALLGYALLVVNWSRIQDALLIGGTAGVLERTQENLRLTVWRLEIDAIGRSPWTGYGWNQASKGQWEVALDHPSLRYLFESSHNLVLDLILWNGILLGSGFVLLLIIFFLRIMLRVKEPGDFWLSTILLAVGCHAFVEYPLSYLYFLLPVAFLAGYLLASVQGTVGTFEINLPNRMAMLLRRVVVAATVALATVISVDYMPWESEWSRLRYEEQKIGLPSGSALPQSLVLDQLEDFMIFSRIEAARGMSEKELEWMRQVTIRYPYPASIFKYASALYLNGHVQLAEKELIRLCKMASREKCESARVEWSRKAFGRD